MIPEFSEDPRYAAWPFWVLELTPAASASDIEKAARDISAKLKFGVAGVERFPLPLGDAMRDEYLVREAKALLQDPARRLQAEFWYVTPGLVQNLLGADSAFNTASTPDGATGAGTESA